MQNKYQNNSLQKSSYSTVQQVNTPSPNSPDPLISKGWEREQYVGIIILFISLIAAVGYLSRRLEYALLFAVTLSIILVVFFLTM
ncbi:hypothetical protein [Anabaena sp. CCY 9613]|uniref:hypothetical protein n=1 Tax=Anabaena sp. CCY 9613 TaxID=3103868 RepID=UPI0039C61952